MSKRKRKRREGGAPAVEPTKPTAVDPPLPPTPSPISKLTDEIAAQLCELAGTPLHKVHIAWMVGIDADTLANWLKRGEAAAEGDEAFSVFSVRYKKARAKFFAERLNTISTASEKSWQASAWLTERLGPDEYSDPGKELARLRNEVAELKKLVTPDGDDDAGDDGEFMARFAAKLAARQSRSGGANRPPEPVPQAAPVDAEPRPAGGSVPE